MQVGWTFQVTDKRSETLSISPLDVPQHIRNSFQKDGFVSFPKAVSLSLVHSLNARLEEILQGNYDRGISPDKSPKLIRRNNNNQQGRRNKTVAPLGFSGNVQNVKVLQVINVHKADQLFRELACSPALGEVIGKLTGWTSVRLAQDQIWAKPPGAPALSFHRDAPYFMFRPSHVVTVWIALDDMDAELGPLEYVRGSHLWEEGKVGISKLFFQTKGGRDLLHSAAEANGVSVDDDLESRIVSMAGLAAGGISIHDGRTWHGSGKNQSKSRPRRGLGLHFVPGNARFTAEAMKSRLWRPYVENNLDDLESLDLPENDFPLTWSI